MNNGKGKESFGTFRVGSRVQSSGKGPLKRGVNGRIIGRSKNNGYNRFQIQWNGGRVSFERTIDIELL